MKSAETSPASSMRPTTTIDPTGTRTLASAFSYEPMGPVKGYTYGNGLTRIMGYDSDGRRISTQVKNGSSFVQNLSYGWNSNNLMGTLTDSVYFSQSQDYGYDELGRLTSANASSGNRGLSYDDTGNRKTHVLNGVTTNYTTAIGSNRLSTLSGGNTRTYQYTPNGNISSFSGTQASTGGSHPALLSVMGVVGGVTGYFWGGTGSGAANGAVAGYASTGTVRAGFIGAVTGLVGSEGSAFSGVIAGAAEGGLNAGRYVNPTHFNATLGPALNGARAGLVGWAAGAAAGAMIDASNSTACTCSAAQ